MVFPLNMPLKSQFTDEELLQFCLNNPELGIERDEHGQLFLSISPTYLLTSTFNSELIAEIIFWNKKSKSGKVFDSNSAFFLPDNSMKGPDVAWISKEKWDKLSISEKKSIPKLVPDFIIELQSETDNIKELKHKMTKWMENGVRLAWLVSPQSKITFVYFKDEISEISFTDKLDGKDVLVGLEMILSDILEE